MRGTWIAAGINFGCETLSQSPLVVELSRDCRYRPAKVGASHRRPNPLQAGGSVALASLFIPSRSGIIAGFREGRSGDECMCMHTVPLSCAVNRFHGGMISSTTVCQ